MKETAKAGVLSIVRRMLAREMENKVIGNVLELNVSHNGAIGAADAVPIVPRIRPIDSTTGSTALQRMGDKIKPKSLTVRGVVTLRPDAGTIQNFYVRVLILSQKNLKTGAQVTAGVDSAHLLRPAIDAVGSDQVSYDGSTQRSLYPVNKDLFKVYMDKTVMICASIPSATGAQQPNATFRWSYTFKSLPASFTFDDGNGNYVNNFAPFLVTGYCYADGTSPDVLSTRVISNAYSKLEFEDA